MEEIDSAVHINIFFKKQKKKFRNSRLFIGNIIDRKKLFIPQCVIFTERNLFKFCPITPSPLAGEGWGEGESN
jgi:hypothetical protein